MPRMGFSSKTLIVIVMVQAMAFSQCADAQHPTSSTAKTGPQSQPRTNRSSVPAVGSLPRRLPPTPSKAIADPTEKLNLPPMKWWTDRVTQQVLDRERWVTFDLETVLLDTLAHSPRVQSVSYRTSSTFQRIVQQDAAFDSTILLGGDLGATNDPVGNTLTTGGADRLREKSLNVRGGARKTTRQGTELEWSQELGFLDSNSSFFLPRDQGNARLSLSLTKPLLSRGGRYYNERLVTQARIESRVAWQDMRGEVEQRIADVIIAYWKLYEARAQLTQQRELLARSQYLERVLVSRQDFDAALIEITKAKQRVARRADQLIDLEAELKKQQSRLAALIGSEAMLGVESDLELIPIAVPEIPESQWSLRDAVAQALENRPEVRAATHDVELSALELRVTRVELEPQLNWVFNGYLSQLNGASKVTRSFGEQFANAPGISTGLEFELPRGRRAVRAQQREAMLRARQRNERLREVIQQTQFEVETALIDLQRFEKQLISKRNVLASAITEENILSVQWRIIGGDESRVGIKLENLLDAQQRRTDAEKDMVAVEVAYMIALVQLQRAMGTLLINEGIRPYQSPCSGEIDFLRDEFTANAISTEDAVANPDPIHDEPAAQTPVPIVIGDDDNEVFRQRAKQMMPQSPVIPPRQPERKPLELPAPTNAIPDQSRVPTMGHEALPQQLPVGWGTNDLSSQKLPSTWAPPSSRLQMPSYRSVPQQPQPNLTGGRSAWQLPSDGWTR